MVLFYKLITAQIAIILLCASCNKVQPLKERTSETDAKTVGKLPEPEIDTTSSRPVILHKVTGDFNGDRKPDTLREGFYSRALKEPIRTIPFAESQDEIAHWICQLNPLAYIKTTGIDSLIFSGSNCTTLGLDYLINVGDLDKNGTDEIAVVVNWADFTSVNSCYIFSYCSGKWKQVFSFTIHELIMEEDQEKPGIGIPSFLEKRQGTWYYKDYLKSLQANTEKEEAQMFKVKIKGCR
jgi:hypothetical protein